MAARVFDRRDFDARQLADFTQGYIECLLWASVDDDGEPLDRNFSADDLAMSAVQRINSDCADFLHEPIARDLVSNYGGAARAGHDFWLTRNGHGAGFWDRGYPRDVSDYLTTRAKSYGDADPYCGDDGLIYLG